MVMKPTEEKRMREIRKTVMVPYTEMVKQIRTVQKPVMKLVERQRVDHRIETQISYRTVSEDVRIAVPKPSCPCYSTSCGCAGKSGCGCCAPKCGCAPPKVQWAIQTVSKKVPEAREIRVPIMVPYQEEVQVMQDEHIMHMVPVTVMKPKIVLETIEEIIPIFKEVEEITLTPVIVEVCGNVLVSEGIRSVVQQLTMEEVHQSHKEEEYAKDNNHAGYSRSSDVADPANPNMHAHAIYTNALFQEVSPEASVQLSEEAPVVAACPNGSVAC